MRNFLVFLFIIIIFPVLSCSPEMPMEMVFVKGGCYQMGDTFGDGKRHPHPVFFEYPKSVEEPVHEACVDDFFIGKYEVTMRQWRAIMGNTRFEFTSDPIHEALRMGKPEFTSCDECPIGQVSWHDTQQFINKLNKKTGKNYRLPTEAEWEYAARSGGKNEKYAGTNNKSELGDYAWYSKNSGRMTNPVGMKKPNGLGIYDMSGNVWEWVNDWYDKDYNNSSKDNPKGPRFGKYRVIRGGSYAQEAWFTRSTSRYGYEPDYRARDGLIGFRVVRTQ